MSRVSTLEQMMMAAQPKRKFDFDRLSVIPIACLFSTADIDELIQIATSIRYNANIHKKYELIDQVMRRRGFVKAHAGTNRRVYRFLEDPSFVAKVAVDKVGMKDSPQEYIHQVKFQPFCCKIFEVHPSGVIAFVEKVNPITSLEEMLSVADDIFNLMTTKIVGKYVVDDLGTKTYMNFGVRPNFGPVIIDFPYVYELDSKKLICHNQVKDQFGLESTCGGDIDIVAGFNGYKCLKCGREYKAIDLAKAITQNFNPFEWNEMQYSDHLKKIIAHFRSKVIDRVSGKVVLDSGYKSDLYLSKEECDIMMSNDLPAGTIEVGKIIHEKRIPAQEMRLQYFSELQKKAMEQQLAINKPTIRDIVEEPSSDLIEVGKVIKNPPFNPSRYETTKPLVDDFNSLDGSQLQDVELDSKASEDIIITPEVVSDNKPTPVEPEETSEALESFLHTNEVTIKPASNPTPGQVYSDEQVKSMADENAARNVEVEDGSSGDQAIIDPRQDKEHPEMSPMTRPYANTKEAVYVTTKFEMQHKAVEAPKVNMDSIKPFEEEQSQTEEDDYDDPEEELTDQNITETEKAMLEEAEEESEEGEEEVSKEPEQAIPDVTITDPESDKAYRKGDYNHRKKNAKRRNPYDDD